MLNKNFGIEIEFTGITRNEAAKVAAEYLNGTVVNTGDYYDTKKITTADGRVWKIMSDGSISCQKKQGRQKVAATREYSVELVSPILTYQGDIETLQELVRRLRKAGAFTNNSCGIHIHLDGAEHTARSIRNFVNIIASKNDLFYKALQIAPSRMGYCKKMDEILVEKINRKKPKTLTQIESIWYEGYSESTDRHYHSSRYHFLNLHSFFNGNHTVELRGFNSELHAGKIRSYIVLALALNNQALTQKCASAKKPQVENEKFAMRTYLNRIGFIGEEFANCREHLTTHLEALGSVAISGSLNGCLAKIRRTKTMNKTFYLAYGSNLNLEQMAHRCPTAKPVGPVVLKDYQLLFRGGHGGSVATVEPLKGKTVPCLLWEITPADETALDRYEGFPFLYRKEKVKVKLGKKYIETMVYIMNDGRPLGTPSCYYYSVILEGYKSADFDISILKQAVEDSKEVENG